MTLFQLLNYVEFALTDSCNGDQKELDALKERLYPGAIIAEDTSQLDGINAMRAEMGMPPLDAVPGSRPQLMRAASDEEQLAQIAAMQAEMRQSRAPRPPVVD